jgi:hypothetical protein
MTLATFWRFVKTPRGWTLLDSRLIYDRSCTKWRTGTARPRCALLLLRSSQIGMWRGTPVRTLCATSWKCGPSPWKRPTIAASFPCTSRPIVSFPRWAWSVCLWLHDPSLSELRTRKGPPPSTSPWRAANRHWSLCGFLPSIGLKPSEKQTRRERSPCTSRFQGRLIRWTWSACLFACDRSLFEQPTRTGPSRSMSPRRLANRHWNVYSFSSSKDLRRSALWTHWGGPPLHVAVARGTCSLDLAHLLVGQSCGSVRTRDANGMLPLLLAAATDAPLDVLFYLATTWPESIHEPRTGQPSRSDFRFVAA